MDTHPPVEMKAEFTRDVMSGGSAVIPSEWQKELATDCNLKILRLSKYFETSSSL